MCGSSSGTSGRSSQLSVNGRTTGRAEALAEVVEKVFPLDAATMYDEATSKETGSDANKRDVRLIIRTLLDLDAAISQMSSFFFLQFRIADD
jgi:hypothetical protein